MIQLRYLLRLPRSSLLLSVLVGVLSWTCAATIPTNPAIFFQTSGSARAATIGDWYTTAGSTHTTRFHRFDIVVTQDQLDAAGGTLLLTVNDAESAAGTVGPVDEVTGTADPTRFTLSNNAATTPTSGTKLKQQIFASGSPDGSTFTYAITAAGTYYLLSETGAQYISSPGNSVADLNDDDNSYSITIGSANYTPVIGQYQSSFQHNTVQSYDVFFYVKPGTAGPLSLRNFDMDSPAGTTLTYVRPDGTTVVGTVSGNGVWNGPAASGTLNSGSDSVGIGNSYGWWAMRITNMTANNQAIYEANDGAGNRLPAVFTAPINVNLSKTVDKAAPKVGDTVAYTLTLANTGASTVGATGIHVQDTLPSGLTYLSSSVTQPVNSLSSYNATTGDWYIRNLDSGGRATLTIQARVIQTGTIVNTATLKSVDQPYLERSASVSLAASPGAADLAIDKSGPAAIGSGGSLSYVLRVWNNGPDTTSSVSVNETLPGGFTVTGIACAATGNTTCGTQTFTASSVTITTGTLTLDTVPTNSVPDGNYLSYTLAGTAPANGSLSNTASLSVPTGTTDAIQGNNASTPVQTRIIDAVNDLAVTFSSGGGPVPVTVLGNDTIGGAAATTSNSVVAIANNGGIIGLSVNGGQLIVPVNTAPGTYTVTYNLCDATVTTACDAATVQVTISAPAADLNIIKTNGVGSVVSGATTTYTIRVTNGGPNSVTGAFLKDPAVTGLTQTAAACTATGGNVCTAAPTPTALQSAGGISLPALANGAFYELTVTATVTAANGSVTNTANVAPPGGTTDPNMANNSASDTDTVIVPPSITLLKLGRNITRDTAFIGTSGSIGAQPGETLEYCIVYRNAGGAALNFRLIDNVPAELNASLSAYGAGTGIRWADGTVIAAGTPITPTGVNLTSTGSDADKGSLTTAGGLGRGTLTLDLGAAGLAAGGQGTVCFRTQVP